MTARLQRLLQPSYYPGPDEGPALVAALLRQSPAAGATFCAALAGCLHPPAGGLRFWGLGFGVLGFGVHVIWLGHLHWGGDASRGLMPLSSTGWAVPHPAVCAMSLGIEGLGLGRNP